MTWCELENVKFAPRFSRTLNSLVRLEIKMNDKIMEIVMREVGNMDIEIAKAEVQGLIEELEILLEALVMG